MANAIQQEKIYSRTGAAAGASQTITWKNPPTAAGPHGTSHGAVEITGVYDVLMTWLTTS